MEEVVMQEIYNKISELVISGDIGNITKYTEEALQKGSKASDLLNKALLPGMDIVGQRMKLGELFIPEVLRSAKTMQKSMDILMPLLSESDVTGAGTIVIGTVQGDLHDIGKNLVAMMLEGAGFKVIDLGVDVNPQMFINAIREHNADIMGMSALLTTTIPIMEETIKAVEEAGLREKVKIMAGGAPVTQNLVDDIGADAFGNSAVMAVDKAKELMS
jgi:methylmalonyl-CoA mutase cobalamin-binding domain/chain